MQNLGILKPLGHFPDRVAISYIIDDGTEILASDLMEFVIPLDATHPTPLVLAHRARHVLAPEVLFYLTFASGAFMKLHSTTNQILVLAVDIFLTVAFSVPFQMALAARTFATRVALDCLVFLRCPQVEDRLAINGGTKEQVLVLSHTCIVGKLYVFLIAIAINYRL